MGGPSSWGIHSSGMPLLPRSLTARLRLQVASSGGAENVSCDKAYRTSSRAAVPANTVVGLVGELDWVERSRPAAKAGRVLRMASACGCSRSSPVGLVRMPLRSGDEGPPRLVQPDAPRKLNVPQSVSASQRDHQHEVVALRERRGRGVGTVALVVRVGQAQLGVDHAEHRGVEGVGGIEVVGAGRGIEGTRGSRHGRGAVRPLDPQDDLGRGVRRAHRAVVHEDVDVGDVRAGVLVAGGRVVLEIVDRAVELVERPVHVDGEDVLGGVLDDGARCRLVHVGRGLHLRRAGEEEGAAVHVGEPDLHPPAEADGVAVARRRVARAADGGVHLDVTCGVGDRIGAGEGDHLIDVGVGDALGP